MAGDAPGTRDGGRARDGESLDGLDVRDSTRQELYERARRLGVEGRSRMSKMELARAVAGAQRQKAMR
ncbi:MAG TPA: hypothetical protein VNT51_10980 [Miltoncostaeaceae bacterium]|nr:hypothetical protein [Miltoncostaeaceae bacterium]